MVNIAEPVNLFELVAGTTPAWLGLKTGYEEALKKFENREFRQAARGLAEWQKQQPVPHLSS